jgi:hypothetical protein
MRTATLPAVRVSPETRNLIESVLKEGESLSTFIEQTAKLQATSRKEDDAFYARGLAAAKRVDAGGKTYSHKEVMKELRDMTGKKRTLSGEVKAKLKAA